MDLAIIWHGYGATVSEILSWFLLAGVFLKLALLFVGLLALIDCRLRFGLLMRGLLMLLGRIGCLRVSRFALWLSEIHFLEGCICNGCLRRRRICRIRSRRFGILGGDLSNIFRCICFLEVALFLALFLCGSIVRLWGLVIDILVIPFSV